MTMGSGFAFDMIKSLRNNRTLLKGKDSAHYKNFDTAYITGSIISRQAPAYKKASSRHINAIRTKMEDYNRTLAFKKLLLFLIITVLASAGFYAAFFS